MGKSNNNEFQYNGKVINGFAMIFVTYVLVPVLIGISAVFLMPDQLVLGIIAEAVLFIIFCFGCAGYFVQEPNEGRVLIFFGKYRGTFRGTGYFWVNPLMSRRKISLRIRNMDIEPIKVNDKIGNPVLIGMVLVWRIKDTYRAVFDIDAQGSGGSGVDNAELESFVRIQSDAALREVTGAFAYDDTDSGSDKLTLRSGGEAINELLENKLNERLAIAGIEVIEARLNYLAYAPEIAAVMLRRQQAAAIITAREKIVEGAVSMVKMALEQLDEGNVVQLSEDRKATMVSNLLTVLCSDDPAQPVINAGNS